MSLDFYLEEPVICQHCGHEQDKGGEEVYWRNITHNLGKMAKAVGVYEALWRPDEHGYKKAGQIIGRLNEGIQNLYAHRKKCEELNPSNGWGDYNGFVEFVKATRDACEQHPNALIRVSR